MSSEKPRIIAYKPHPNPIRARAGERIKAEILDMKMIQEDWNIYELVDGTKVRIKVIPREFYVVRDPSTDEVMYNPEGQPLYGMDVGMEVHFDVPEALVKLPKPKSPTEQVV